SSEVTISFDIPQQRATLILMDISGQEIRRMHKQKAADEVTMDMRDYAQGVYLMKIVVGDQLVVKKVMVVTGF
ncbi:MAG: T9SS C-terminal target domain-containing protein, partial [Bacteroidetes bacterium]